MLVLQHQPLQLVQCAITYAKLVEVFDRIKQVIGAPAQPAFGPGDHGSGLLGRDVRQVAGVITIDHEGCGSAWTQRRAQGQQPGPVGAAHHLPVPDDVEFSLGQCRIDPIANAAAGTAWLKRQHQARTVRRAASGRRPQAEAAMVAVQQGRLAVQVVDTRIPHQRTVAEQPDFVIADRLEDGTLGGLPLCRWQPGGQAQPFGLLDLFLNQPGLDVLAG